MALRDPGVVGRERPIVGGGEAAWWLPVLSLLHGNRLSEFAQLRVSDVIHEGDYIGLSVSDEGDGQHVKNGRSTRIVPLHPARRTCRDCPARMLVVVVDKHAAMTTKSGLENIRSQYHAIVRLNAYDALSGG